MKIKGVVAFFKLVEFFENGNGNGDVVFLETEGAGAVVQNDVGIEK